MSPAQMRAFLKKEYPFEKWSQRVDKMSDNQVAATYMRMINQKRK